MKIFSLDDDKTLLAFLDKQIKVLGHQSSCFENVKELYEALETGNQPDLLLVDLNMPDTNGLDVLSYMRSRFFELPVVIITSTRDTQVTIDALNFGAHGFLLKPLVFEELKNLLDKVTVEKQLRKELEATQAHVQMTQRKADFGMLASGVAHEINNPNASIRGNAQLAQKLWDKILPFLENGSLKDEPKLAYAKSELPAVFQSILNSSNRISQITTALGLTTPEALPINGVANISIGLLTARRTLKERLEQVELKILGLPPGLTHALLPQEQWNQVVLNLISYALAQSKSETSPHIQIEFSWEASQKFKMSVSFSGKGPSGAEGREFFSPNPLPPSPGDEALLYLQLTELFLSGNQGRFSLINTEGNTTTMSATLPSVEKNLSLQQTG